MRSLLATFFLQKVWIAKEQGATETQTELFINELKERDLKYRDIRTLQDGDDLVEVGFNLDSTRIRIMIFFDASEKSVALRCFEVTRVTEEQYPNAMN